MNILYSCDDKYSPYTGVSITSLFESNKELDEINVYVLGLGLSELNLMKFKKLEETYSRRITIIDAKEIDDYLAERGAKLWHSSRATFFRLFVQQVLPDDVENILYMDSDIVIVDSLAELENFEFEENKACAMTYLRLFEGYNKYIGLKENDKCYATATLFINMPNWRKLNCHERIMNNIDKGYARFYAVDVDLASHTLQENIQLLPAKYSVVPDWVEFGHPSNLLYYCDADEKNYYSVQELEDAVSNPVILHCASGNTFVPWVKGSKHPFKQEWEAYKKISLWKDIDQIEVKTNLRRKIQIALYIILSQKWSQKWYCRICKVNNKLRIHMHYKKNKLIWGVKSETK